MKSKPIKGTKLKTATNPETIISIKQDIIDFEIQKNKLLNQLNKLQNKILEKQRKLLNFKEGSFFTECEFKDFPNT